MMLLMNMGIPSRLTVKECKEIHSRLTVKICKARSTNGAKPLLFLYRVAAALSS
jgi:hypothetical protein